MARARRLPFTIAPTDGWRNLQEVEFTVPGQPIPKGRPRWAPRGNTYTPARTVQAEKNIADYFKIAYPFLSPTNAILGLRVTCFLMGGRQGDVDNYLKLCMDALNKRAFFDDGQIRDARVTLVEVTQYPHTDITIYRLSPAADAA